MGRPLAGGLGGVLDLNDVLAGLTDVLSGVLTGVLDEAGPPQGGTEDICDGECEVLDLALGPVDLTLLGLNVHLDDCTNGPVQVCLSASAGEGLLGDLLCGLAGGGVLPDLGTLQDLLGVIDPLLDADLTAQQVNKLIAQVGEWLGDDGVLSNKDLGKIAKLVGQTAGPPVVDPTRAREGRPRQAVLDGPASASRAPRGPWLKE